MWKDNKELNKWYKDNFLPFFESYDKEYSEWVYIKHKSLKTFVESKGGKSYAEKMSNKANSLFEQFSNKHDEYKKAYDAYVDKVKGGDYSWSDKQKESAVNAINKSKARVSERESTVNKEVKYSVQKIISGEGSSLRIDCKIVFDDENIKNPDKETTNNTYVPTSEDKENIRKYEKAKCQLEEREKRLEPRYEDWKKLENEIADSGSVKQWTRWIETCEGTWICSHTFLLRMNQSKNIWKKALDEINNKEDEEKKKDAAEESGGKEYVNKDVLEANQSTEQKAAMAAAEPNPGADMMDGKDTSVQTKSDEQKETEGGGTPAENSSSGGSSMSTNESKLSDTNRINADQARQMLSNSSSGSSGSSVGSIGSNLMQASQSLMAGDASTLASQGVGLLSAGVNSMASGGGVGGVVGSSLQVAGSTAGLVTNSVVGATGTLLNAAAKADLIKNLAATSVQTFMSESLNMLNTYITKTTLYVASMPLKIVAYTTSRTQVLISQKTADIMKNFTIEPEELIEMKAEAAKSLQQNEKLAKVKEKIQKAKEKIDKATEKVSKGIEMANSYIDMGTDWVCEKINTYIQMGLDYEGAYLGMGYKFVTDEVDKFVHEQGEKIAQKLADKAAKLAEEKLKKAMDKVKEAKAKAMAKAKALAQKAILKLKAMLGMPP